MISQENYDKCRNLLRKLVDQITLRYKQVVEPRERWVKSDSFEYLAYEGIDPDAFGREVIEQLISSESFNDFYKQLMDGKPITDFYLYGKRFCIDVYQELNTF